MEEQHLGIMCLRRVSDSGAWGASAKTGALFYYEFRC